MLTRVAILPVLLLSCIAPVGCKHEIMERPKEGPYQQHLAVIPATATQVAEGRAMIAYKSDRTGLLYLYDAETSRVLDAQRIGKGQTYTVSAARNTVYMNDKGMPLTGLSAQHLLRVYVDPD